MPNSRALIVAVLAALAAAPLSAMVLRSIQVDGAMADWQGVLMSSANTIVDRAWNDADPDTPRDVSFDLRTFAVTWDASNLYLYWDRPTRKGQDKTKVVFLAYIDRDDDGLMTANDFVLILRTKDDSLSDNGLYRYVPNNPAGDILPGDGNPPPGSGGARVAAANARAQPDPSGTVEVALDWNSLGVPAGRNLRIQPAIMRLGELGDTASDAAAVLPGGVEDNGGVLDTAFVRANLSAGREVGGTGGTWTSFPHQVTLSGNVAPTLELTSSIDDNLRIELWSDPNADGDASDGQWMATDVDGNGVYTDPGDTIAPGADSNGNNQPDTGPIGVGQGFAFVERVWIPSPATLTGARSLTVVVRSLAYPSLSASTTDRLLLDAVTMTSGRQRWAVAGSEVPFSHRVCNLSPATTELVLEAASGRRWATSLWIGGIPASRVVLDAGTCADFEARVVVPISAAIDSTDILLLTATNAVQESASASNLIQVAPPLTVEPNGSAWSQAGSSIFLAHTVRNATATARVFDLTGVVATPNGVSVWSDPNGDGIAGDGQPIALTAAIEPFGGESLVLLQIDLSPWLVAGETVSATLRARDTAESSLTATSVDTITIRLLQTFATDPPAAHSTSFPGCSAITALAGPLDSKEQYRFRWFDANAQLIQVSPVRSTDANDKVEDRITLLASDPEGTWNVFLDVRQGSSWLPVSPGGTLAFRVRRDLRPDFAAVTLLAVDRADYAVAGDSLSLSAVLQNNSAFAFDNSVVDYIVFRDVNFDGRPTAGEPFVQLDGSVGSFSPGLRTCRATALPAVQPGDNLAENRCQGLGPIDFGATGAWFVEANWKTSCGDEMAQRLRSFNVGCAAVSLAVDAGPDRLVCAGFPTRIGTTPIPGLQYLWTPGDFLDDATAAEPFATAESTLTFSLSVLDSAGCVARDDVLVLVTPGPVADAGPSASICRGDQVQMGSTDDPFYLYQWSPATGLDDPSVARPWASPATTTSYTLSVTDPDLGCLETRTAVVTVGRIPPADAGPDVTGPGVLGPSTCDPDAVYQWSPVAGLDNPLACQPNASPTLTTEYCVTVRDRPSGCDADPACAWVGGTACPRADAGADAIGPVAIGPGTCNPSFTYAWSPATGLDDPTACRPSASPSSPTEYCLVVTDPSIACSGLRDCVIVGLPCSQTPEPIPLLRASRRGQDVYLEWSQAPGAAGGYRVYRASARTDLSLPANAGVRVPTTPYDPTAVNGIDPAAIVEADVRYYRVVAVCGDGVTEGP